jgi:mono/diheme cytochrome c family protein
MMGHTALLACLCISWNAGTAHSSPTKSLPAGEAIYQIHCLRCHGQLGDGKGPDATALLVPPRDFHSPESTAKTDFELRAIIIWGIVFSPMHGWWDRLTVDEIREVIGYIRQLAPYQPRI